MDGALDTVEDIMKGILVFHKGSTSDGAEALLENKGVVFDLLQRLVAITGKILGTRLEEKYWELDATDRGTALAGIPSYDARADYKRVIDPLLDVLLTNIIPPPPVTVEALKEQLPPGSTFACMNLDTLRHQGERDMTQRHTVGEGLLSLFGIAQRKSFTTRRGAVFAVNLSRVTHNLRYSLTFLQQVGLNGPSRRTYAELLGDGKKRTATHATARGADFFDARQAYVGFKYVLMIYLDNLQWTYRQGDIGGVYKVWDHIISFAMKIKSRVQYESKLFEHLPSEHTPERFDSIFKAAWAQAEARMQPAPVETEAIWRATLAEVEVKREVETKRVVEATRGVGQAPMGTVPVVHSGANGAGPVALAAEAPGSAGQASDNDEVLELAGEVDELGISDNGIGPGESDAFHFVQPRPGDDAKFDEGAEPHCLMALATALLSGFHGSMGDALAPPLGCNTRVCVKEGCSLAYGVYHICKNSFGRKNCALTNQKGEGCRSALVDVKTLHEEYASEIRENMVGSVPAKEEKRDYIKSEFCLIQDETTTVGKVAIAGTIPKLCGY